MTKNDLIKNLSDEYEISRILYETFYMFLDEKSKILALTEAAERIKDEVYDVLEEK